MMDDDFNLVGALIAERYSVESVVAKGGYGVVYRALHVALDMPVALKVLRVPAGFSIESQRLFIHQFEGEAKIIARLNHPAVVRVLDRGVIVFQDYSEAPWMALEWIDGVTLAEDLQQRGDRARRSVIECLHLARPVLEALAIAHLDNIVHRDLKPANLMLPTLPEGAKQSGLRSMPLMRVLDFGIAKVTLSPEAPGTGHTSTTAAVPAYTPRYAAPEQVSGTRTGAWTDVHALGLILTEMLTGKAAYAAVDKMELQIQVLAERRPTPGVHGVDVGPWEAILARAMALRPADRYSDAGALLRALDDALPHTTNQEVPRNLRGLRLEFLAPAGVPAPVQLHRLPLVLGRSDGADVPLPFNSISREHARVYADGDRLMIEDLGSSNGVTVNGVRTTRAPLGRGDTVQIGIVEFRVTRTGDDTVVIQRAKVEAVAPRRSTKVVVIGALGASLAIGIASSFVFARFSRPAALERQRLASLRDGVGEAPSTLVAPARHPPAEDAAPAPARSLEGASPLERAQRCRQVFLTDAERNDCVISALHDGGSSELELRMLVAAYQATGQRTSAAGVMRAYIEQYPYGSMAGTFQQYLLHNGGN